MTPRGLLPTAVGSGEIVVHVLGSGSGWPTPRRDTSSLLIGVADGWSLVECPGSIVHKLAVLGLLPGDLRRLILTHNHVDHIYGLAHLLQAMAIAGAPVTFELLAPRQTIETVHGVVETHGLDDKHHPRLELVEIELSDEPQVVPVEGLRLRAVRTAHSRDTAALRFEAGDVAVCYSSDTRPCEAVAQLARDADILWHECGGLHRQREAFSQGHSSALEAGRIASEAGARRLALMHLGSRDDRELLECVQEASGAFEGPVALAEDGETWTLSETMEDR